MSKMELRILAVKQKIKYLISLFQQTMKHSAILMTMLMTMMVNSFTLDMISQQENIKSKIKAKAMEYSIDLIPQS